MLHPNPNTQRYLKLGKELKSFREEANLSIKETADSTYLSEEEIVNIEDNGVWSDRVGTLLSYFYLYRYMKMLFPHSGRKLKEKSSDLSHI